MIALIGLTPFWRNVICLSFATGRFMQKRRESSSLLKVRWLPKPTPVAKFILRCGGFIKQRTSCFPVNECLTDTMISGIERT